jgi:dienelactone hydrolase
MKYWLHILFLHVFLFPLTAAAAGMDVVYYDGDTPLEGYWAPSTCLSETPAPVVLVIHQWKGLGAYEKMRADMLATQCYNAFAVDMYGKGIRPQSNEEAGALAGTFKNDPQMARRRMTAALNFARMDGSVDGTRVAAIGYCFGGGMALELARSGSNISSVISFHGNLASKEPVTAPGIIHAMVQVHHGADDPHVPPDEIAAFKTEMAGARTDLEFISYPGAVHAFTDKRAGNDPAAGVAYNAEADRQSWATALEFLDKTLKTGPSPE